MQKAKNAASAPEISLTDRLKGSLGMWLLVGLILLVYLWIRSHFWAIPMERDEGIYTYIGEQVRAGKMPYVDFYESRLPGIFYMYALMTAIFGNFEGLAFGFTLLNMGSMIFIFLLARILLKHTPGAFMAMVTAGFLGLAPEVSGFTRQSEHIVVFWLTGSLYLLFRGFEAKKNLNFLLSGIFMALAFITKANAVYYVMASLLLLVMTPLLDGNGDPLGQRLLRAVKPAMLWGSGALGVLVLLGAYMAYLGVWDEMMFWSFTYSRHYVGQIPFSAGMQLLGLSLKHIVPPHFMLWLPALLGLVIYPAWVRREVGWVKSLAVPLLFAAGFLATTPGFYFYQHYFLMTVPMVGLALGAGFVAVYRYFGAHPTLEKALSGLFAALLFINFYSRNDDPKTGRSYYTHPNYAKVLFYTYTGNPFMEAWETSEFLKTKMQPGDEIALIGSEPELYIYTGARSVSRHAYFSHMMADTTAIPEAKVWQQEFIADVEGKRPRFIVCFNHTISLLMNPNSDTRVLVRVMQEFVPRQYHLIGAADLVGTDQPTYIWDEEKVKTYNFQRLSNGLMANTILVFERGGPPPVILPAPADTAATSSPPNP